MIDSFSIRIPFSLLLYLLRLLLLLSKIGNFGQVYYGLWDGTPVALKQLNNSESIAEFKQEATMLL